MAEPEGCEVVVLVMEEEVVEGGRGGTMRGGGWRCWKARRTVVNAPRSGSSVSRKLIMVQLEYMASN